MIGKGQPPVNLNIIDTGRIVSRVFDDADGRADIYSLGVMLYQMLTGQQPFAGDDGTISSVIVKHLMESPPPMQQFNEAVPANIEKLVMQALAKEATQRPTAREFAQELARAFNIDIIFSDSGDFRFTLPPGQYQ